MKACFIVTLVIIFVCYSAPLNAQLKHNELQVREAIKGMKLGDSVSEIMEKLRPFRLTSGPDLVYCETAENSGYIFVFGQSDNKEVGLIAVTQLGADGKMQWILPKGKQ